MIETMFLNDTLNSYTAFLCALVLGVAFGWCIEQAGLGSSKRVTGVFYFTDMSLLKVMLSAVVTSVIGLGLLFTTGLLKPESIFIQPTILGAQVVGGLLFGVGLAMSGWCPGTAAVGAASGKIDAVFFIFGALLGCYLFNLSFDHIEFWYAWGNIGESLAFKEVGMRFHDFVLLFTVVAVVGFWLCELIEEKFSFVNVAARSSGLWVFSVIALLGASLVVAASMPGRISLNDKGSVQLSSVIDEVYSGKDLIKPEDLAREIVAGQKKIALIDLRNPEEFEKKKIRGSVNAVFTALKPMLERYGKHDRIVFYSADNINAGKAWVLARVMGYDNVFVLDGGIRSFFEKVLKPVSLRDEPVDEQLKLEINNWRQIFEGSGMAAGAAEPFNSTMPANSPH